MGTDPDVRKGQTLGRGTDPNLLYHLAGQNAETAQGPRTILFEAIHLATKARRPPIAITGPDFGVTTALTCLTCSQGRTTFQRLRVTVEGNGAVTSTPAGITNCRDDCLALFEEGTSVTLTATAETNSSLTRWSGCSTSTTSSVTVQMTQARTCTGTFTANLGSSNQAPAVDAGTAQTIRLPTNMVPLNGTVTDDGLPNPPGVVTSRWAQVSGPPNGVIFGNANAVDTTARFSQAGTYELRLEADDSASKASSQVLITVNPALGGGPSGKRGETRRVSVSSGGAQQTEPTEADQPSFGVALSEDGRYVAFTSFASNLVPFTDTNGVNDIFVHDRQTGQTTRVSVASDGTQANDRSLVVALSGDGRVVAFDSEASNLVPGDTNGSRDVFVHDRQTGQTTGVSVASDGAQANGFSSRAALVADGRVVAFDSLATNLVPGDTNSTWDVFVHDRQTGQTTRVSVASDGTQANERSFFVTLSGDGQVVAFDSEASNLVPGDTNGVDDVFVHDRQTGETTRVSVANNGTQGDNSSFRGRISANGRVVAFSSDATKLVPGDTNGKTDVFVHFRRGIVPFDLNGDGQADLVWRHTNGTVAVWLMNGLARQAVGVPGRVATDWRIAGVGDVDGDGQADLVWRHTNGTVAIWLMNGLAREAVGVPGQVATTWRIAGVGDVDGDGRADLVWRHSNGTVAIWLMNGLAREAVGVPGRMATTWRIAGVGDVDGDGQADLVWRHTSTRDVAIWLMNGLARKEAGVPGRVPLNWTLEGVSDVNGDGQADLVWHETSGGTVAIWLMNGLTRQEVGVPGSAATEWQIQPD